VTPYSVARSRVPYFRARMRGAKSRRNCFAMSQHPSLRLVFATVPRCRLDVIPEVLAIFPEVFRRYSIHPADRAKFFTS
jgi:hypothetical protein